MPELPEVETIRRGLARSVLDKKIKAIQINWPPAVKTDLTDFVSSLSDSSINQIDRKGKLLIFELTGEKKFLLVHLKMTGQLIYQLGKQMVAGGHKLSETDWQVPNKQTRVIFKFADKSTLYFNDSRKFGYLKIVDRAAKDKIAAGFGVEPLSPAFTLKKIKEILKGKKTSLKALLLNQALVAGIGNIYADEICFAAGVKPSRPASQLTDAEIKKLYRCSQSILRQAIKYGGTTWRDFIDHNGKKGNFTNYLKVYGQAGQSCARCRKGVIKKIKVAGRGTCYCPSCQR